MAGGGGFSRGSMPDFPISRRQAMGTLAAGASIGMPAAAKAGATAASAWDFIVVGAGVFGAWTAWNLQRRGHNTLLLDAWGAAHNRSEEHTSELQSLMRISYAVSCL